MPNGSGSAAGDVGLARIGLRILGAMQLSAARGTTTECLAKRSHRSWSAGDRIHGTRPSALAGIVQASAPVLVERRDS